MSRDDETNRTAFCDLYEALTDWYLSSDSEFASQAAFEGVLLGAVRGFVGRVCASEIPEEKLLTEREVRQKLARCEVTQGQLHRLSTPELVVDLYEPSNYHPSLPQRELLRAAYTSSGDAPLSVHRRTDTCPPLRLAHVIVDLTRSMVEAARGEVLDTEGSRGDSARISVPGVYARRGSVEEHALVKLHLSSLVLISG